MLLKQAKKVKEGKQVDDFFSYLAKTEELLSTKSGATTVAEFLDPAHIKRALATRAAFVTMQVHTLLTESKEPSKTKQNELFAMEVNKMTKLHLIYIMYERANKKLLSMAPKDPNVIKTFITVFSNFALKQLLIDPMPLFEAGFFDASSGKLLEAAYKQTLVDLRPQMIGLVELVPDGGLKSTIGNEYGDIYMKQFEVA